MPDVYATIAEVEPAVQKRLADMIELRAADPNYQAMVQAYLTDVQFPDAARVLEIGSGTGNVTRTLAKWPGVGHAVGVDPSPVFVERSRELSRGMDNVSFEVGDGRALPFDPDTFDVVVLHTTMSHVPQPEKLLTEARRVMRPGGWLAVFDGDYATATVAIGDLDPLESCVHAFRENFINDPWLVRRLPQMLRAGGFDPMPVRSHGYVEAPHVGYMLSWIDRGADALAQAGRIGADTAESLKVEARRRSDSGAWFGYIGFASVLSRKPVQ